MSFRRRISLTASAAVAVAIVVASVSAYLIVGAQMLLIVFYTGVITICLPEFWAHPYGPLLKNLPLLAAIAVLHELDDAR